VLAVRNCCYVYVCSAARGALGPTGEERGGAYRGGRGLQLVTISSSSMKEYYYGVINIGGRF